LALDEQAVAMVKHGPASASALHEVPQGVRCMQLGLEQVLRDARRFIQMPIKRLSCINRGGGSPHHQGDAPRAVALPDGGDPHREVIGIESGPGQPIVAALPLGESGRQAPFGPFEARDAADPGRQWRGGEIVGRQRFAPLLQRGKQRRLAISGRANHRTRCDG
jgi:hypothetical protein